MSCEERGYHRISVVLPELVCVECGREFTPEETIANEHKKIEKTGMLKRQRAAGRDGGRG